MYDVMQKKIKNLEFVQDVNFDIIDSLKNNGTKYPLTLTIHVQRFAIPKRLLILQLLLLKDTVEWVLYTFSTTCFIKANLCDTLSSRTPTLKSLNLPVTWCQSSRLVQLGLGLNLVDCCPDATFVPYRHLLIDLPPRTEDRLRFCTNTGSIPSKSNSSDWLNYSKLLDNEYAKIFYSPNVESFPHKRKCLFLQSFRKKFVRVLCVCTVNLLQGILQDIKIHHVTKFRNKVWLLFLKKKHLEATRTRSGIRKKTYN